MMYTFPNKLRNLAFVFMVIGFLGLVYGFITAPKTIEEAKDMIAANHEDAHGTSHDDSGIQYVTDVNTQDSHNTTHHNENEQKLTKDQIIDILFIDKENNA